MSFQVQPQAQPQQPVQVYPVTSVTNQPPNSHHSNGSFGTVFIVLAVILVISLLACFLGRLCSRRSHPESHGGGHGHKPFKQQNMNHNQNQIHHFRPQEGGDVELGFDKRIPTTKPNGLGHGPGPGYGGQGSRPLAYVGGGGGGRGSNGFSGNEDKGFEMKNGGERSQREPGHGPRPGHGLGYGGRGPRPILYGGGRGNGGEEKGFEMNNGGEKSMREHGHDAPYKFTL